ncbi:unnamed protein product [Symbiodinium sp. CCMP2592]|nr:unnamed protein product [Symbiodinium sp. CCMP2592]
MQAKYGEKMSAEEAEKYWREKMKPWIVIQRQKKAEPAEGKRSRDRGRSGSRQKSRDRRSRGKRESRSRRSPEAKSAEKLSQAAKAAEEWKDDGGEIRASETRQYPEDQEFYSFEALKTKLSEKPLQEVEDLWRSRMKPQWVLHEQERAAAVAWKDDGGDINVAANLRWELNVNHKLQLVAIAGCISTR